MECPICIDKIKKGVECIGCNYVACKKCYTQYIMGSERDYVMCMNCNLRFNRSTLVNMFSKSFVTKNLVEHQREIWYKQQQTKFPEVLPIVERMMELIQLDKEQTELSQETKNKTIRNRLKAIKNRQKILKKELRDLKDTDESSKNKYIRPCLNMECNGFLDKKYYCSICNTIFCKECFEIKEDDKHVCDEDVKKNILLLKQDTKNCPTCSTGIFKIDGCDQMFCTNCNTAFSWKTGEIERGRMHNPHYFEFIRTMGIEIPNPNDPEVECEIHPHTITTIFHCASFFRKGSFISNTILFFNEMIRINEHIVNNLDMYQRDIQGVHKNFKKYTIDYLLGKITKEKYKSILSSGYKKIELRQELSCIAQTSVSIITEVVNQVTQYLLSMQLQKKLNDKFDPTICVYLVKKINMLRKILLQAYEENKKISKLFDSSIFTEYHMHIELILELPMYRYIRHWIDTYVD